MEMVVKSTAVSSASSTVMFVVGETPTAALAGTMLARVGGLLVAVGFLMRSACFFLICTMFVAVAYHIAEPGKGLSAIENFNYFITNPLSLLLVFLGLMFTGPGRFSVQKE